MEKNLINRVLPFSRSSSPSGTSCQEEILQTKLDLTTFATGMGFWDLNPHTGEMECDPQCRRVLGLPDTVDLSYKTLLVLLHPEDRLRVESSLDQMITEERREPLSLSFRVLVPDGGIRVLAANARAVYEESEGLCRVACILGTVLEITDRLKQEEALRRTEKLAAAGKLTASIAHEINNPLEAVGNLLYLARKAGSLEEIQKYLNLADQELTRVTSLTTLTLQFHRQSSQAGPTDVGEICHSVVDLYSSRIVSKGIEIRLRLKAAPRVKAYASELRQVIANLVVNAVDSMPQGGSLSLRLRPSTSPVDGTVGVRFTVADTGQGIASADLPHIFESFFTTKGEAGTGLGLWVVKQILDKHHGCLLVRTSQRMGKSGTVFSIFLPEAAVNGLGLEQTKVA